MARRRTGLSSILVALLLLVPVATSSAHDEAFVVIVHPQNAATSLEREFLRAAYLKEGVKWRDGSAVIPIELADSFPAHARFVEAIIGKTSSQLRNYWVQRIFSGRGTPPLQAQSAHEAIARVLSDPRAVAYLPAGTNPGRAKSITLRLH